MQIGRLVLMLGIAGLILIAAAACEYNQNTLGSSRQVLFSEQPSLAYSLQDHKRTLDRWPPARIVLRHNIPWMPDSMKALMRRLGSG